MAESGSEETSSNNSPNDEHLTKVECAVCLLTSVHPAELPCGHIFCYLCIKGIVNQDRRCALCRQNIPVDYLDKPKLLSPVDADITYSNHCFEDGHLWFYEGHNGWWQYDERTNLELESAYQKNERSCDLLIAGNLYIADFGWMLQYRKDDPSRRRRIKRDLATASKKGIAGLKPTKNCYSTFSNSQEIVSSGIIQNLSVSASSDTNGLNNAQIVAASSNNGVQHTEGAQEPQRLTGVSSSVSVPATTPVVSTNSTTISQTDSTLLYPPNINLDSAIQNTLDWTIEQIESLNIELINDYEALLRDVDNFVRLQDSLNQIRGRRTPNNYLSRYLSTRSVSAHGNNTSTVNSLTDISHLSNSNLDNVPENPAEVALEESDPVYSEVEIPSESFSLQSNSEEPTARERSRSRSRGVSLRHSFSLDSDTLLNLFMSSK